jgi:hypothetical protein
MNKETNDPKTTMDTTLAVQNTVEKLAQLILRQYGCEISYLELSTLPALLCKALAKGNTVTQEENVYLPILTENTLLGVVNVKHGHDLSESVIAYLHSIAQLLLEAAILSSIKIEKIEAIEKQMTMATEIQSKVTPMSHFRQNQFSITGSPKSDYQNEFDFACLIESENSFDIFKMALEIHQAAARLVFLPFQDLEAGIEKSVENLNKIGRVTIFIEDIKKLTLEQQSDLSHFLTLRVPKQSPQIVVGTALSYSELKADPQINQAFLKQISMGYLHLSQPFATYKKENLLNFFFEGLSGRTRLNSINAAFDMVNTSTNGENLTALEKLIDYLGPKPPTH